MRPSVDRRGRPSGGADAVPSAQRAGTQPRHSRPGAQSGFGAWSVSQTIAQLRTLRSAPTVVVSRRVGNPARDPRGHASHRDLQLMKTPGEGDQKACRPRPARRGYELSLYSEGDRLVYASHLSEKRGRSQERATDAAHRQHLSMRPGSGLYVAREPRQPRILMRDARGVPHLSHCSTVPQSKST